jgi:hypothetical protein
LSGIAKIGFLGTKFIIKRLLNCGHSLCEICLLALFQKAKRVAKEFICPTCNTIHKEIKSEEDVKNLIKNFNLLRIVEKIEKRMSSSMSISKYVTENDQTSLYTLANQEKENSEQSSEQKCKKHNNIALLNATGTNMLLCEACVKETNLKAYPLPSVRQN